jgi:hypothetical protein
MSIRRNLLQVEELGSRILPSASPLAFSGVVAPFRASFVEQQDVRHEHQDALHQQQHALHGIGFGAYTSTMALPDTGTSYNLQGFGRFGTVGLASVSGDIHGVGFILHGHATGMLTFTNAKGSVTVSLTGPEQASFSPLPQQFQYQVTSGTGAYQNLHDQGTLHLQLVGSTATPGSPGHGVFTIRI